MSGSAGAGLTHGQVGARQCVDSAIVGARTEAHWQSYQQALELTLTDEDETFIDALITPGHASTPGFNDPAHFVSGRRPHDR